MPAPVPEVRGEVIEIAALRYIDLEQGTGEPAAPGKQYSVHYNGWLRDGTVFDSTYKRNEPFVFVQGRRQVIAGWEIAFQGMRVGGKRRIFIPPHMAYGDRGSADGAVPPNAEMIQDVELVAVSDPPPTPAAAADLLLPLNNLASKVLALAKAVPEEKYSWRPAPGVRSFGEVFVHITHGNHIFLDIAANSPTREQLIGKVQEYGKAEKEALTKDQIIALLTENFAAVKESLEQTTARRLGREVDLFGYPTTRRGVLVTLETHIAEHLGQAIAYARMNGIAPPWSAGQP
jgi:peptidylprolyl isomerase/FKBP-type peptidyl-prolyl cis-trans isomerase FkpA